MSLKARLFVHDGIGVKRRLLQTEDNLPFRLDFDFWSQRTDRIRCGEIFMARVTARDPGGGGWFVDLGQGWPGFLRTNKSPPTLGALLPVRVTIEAQADKSPVCVRTDLPKELVKDKPGKVSVARSMAFFQGVDIIEEVEGREAVDAIDGAIETVIAGSSTITGGGEIFWSSTKALVAIDVDAAERQSGGHRESFAEKLNMDACDAIARCLCLSGLAGLCVVDFLKFHRKQADAEGRIVEALSAALLKYYGRKCDVGRFSQFGLLDFSIARGVTPHRALLETISDVENEALHVFKELERLGLEDKSTLFEVSLADQLYEWLCQQHDSWFKHLEMRFGSRFRFRTDPCLKGLSSQIRRSN